MNIVSILPIDCIKEIFKIVNTKDICNLISVCKDFKNIIKETELVLDFKNIPFIDIFLRFFKNIYSINLSDTNITDKGLEYLKGVHIIDLSGCQMITDKGLEYLKGVHTINLESTKITDKGLQYLKGVHTIKYRIYKNNR